jgi:hypothetical protein
MVTDFQVVFATWLLFVFAMCAIGVVALIAGAIWIYGDAQRRGMDAALWLILLILATLFGLGIVGFAVVLIIYLFVRENHPVGGAMPYGYGPGPGFAPGPAPPQAAPAPAPCPVCGSPMMWYPQYQRWYCATCATYR